MATPQSLVTLTLNPAIDRTYTVEHFSAGQVNRAKAVDVYAGGKGINVARAFRRLGGHVIAAGLLGGANGTQLRELLTNEGISHDFTVLASETRSAIIVIDPDSHTQTVVNEIGPNVSADEVAELELSLAELVAKARCLALCGSLPPGLPPDFYSRLISRLRGTDVRVALDSSGATLIDGLGARPYVVKPNKVELEVLGINVESLEQAALAALEVRSMFGVPNVLITCGSDGAAISAPQGTWWAKAPKVDVVSAVGSGDSFLAGFLWSDLQDGQDPAGALAFAVAAGAANATTRSAGDVSAELIAALSGRIVTTRIV